VCNIPTEGSDSLPSNLHALHIIELKKTINNQKKMLTEPDNTIIRHENTITTLSSANTKLNNILEDGQ
jgi:hypothetical protein